ncbi:MAG: FtsX-like permease family protein [Phenylobacterium sp.]|uniref:ABC transporter permease n=1 Tax=Phenylobacterium sp. TaxID=1871053 RepID=UPI0025D00DAA|nr:ABC transporter permease [Phenylobacterium sp.]MBI1199528.1 FtsX-like permease family protein [Phenylobacterium sp.]
MLAALAWRNLWRRKIRTWLSVASMAFATALLVFMLSFQLGSYATMKANALRLFEGFARIEPAGYTDDPDVRRMIADPEAAAAAARKVPGVSAAAPRAAAYVILANGERSYGAALDGVDPAREPRVSTLSATIRQGRYLKEGDDDAIVLGDALARDLGLKLGDRVTVLGSAADQTVAADSLRLVGVFHTGLGDVDRQVAEMPLARFQDTFAMYGAANVVVLGGESLGEVTRALPAVRAALGDKSLKVQDWGALMPGLKQAITLDFSTSMFWYASLVVVVAFIILNTLIMSALERTREFGMLLALGMRAEKIAGMMWLEMLFLAVMGAGAGIAVGGAATLWFEGHGIAIAGLEGLMAQWGLPGRIYPTLSAVSALSGPLAIVASVALGGLIPYGRVRALKPVAAMRAA